MSVVVVTGSTGFIGRAVCRRLLAAGHEVHGAARGRPTRDLLDAGLHPAPGIATWLGGAELDDAGRATLDRADAVIHLAGDPTYGNGVHYAEANTAPTVRLVDHLATVDRPPRLVLGSSMGAQDRSLECGLDVLLDETAEPAPSSDYGRSKLDAEAAVQRSGVPACSARLGMVVGREMRPSSHLSSLCELARRVPPSVLRHLGGGLPIVHVDDAAAALELLALHPDARGAYLVVAHNVSISDVADRVAGRHGAGSAATTAVASPLRAHLPFALRSVLFPELRFDSAKLRGLGWVPEVSWQDAVDEVRDIVAERHDSSRAPRGWTVVTGAGSGLGRAVAVALADRDRRLLLVDRDPDALAAIGEGLSGSLALAADVTDADFATRVLDRLAPERDGHLAELFLCAGVGRKGAVGSVDTDRELAAVDVNLRARVAIVNELLHELRARNFGRIVLVSSSSAFQPLAGFATYCAANAGLLRFGEALGAELAGSGVQVLTVCPGGMDTGFQDAAGVRRVDGERLLDPADVATAMLDALDRGRSPLVVGGRAKAMDLAGRIVPASLQRRLWSRLVDATR